MSPSPQFRFLCDAPGGDGDLWDGLQSVSHRLAQLVPGLPKDSPILLSGPWGSGKTTLLRAVRRQLENQFLPEGEIWKDVDSPRKTVWFEAWRYEGETALLPALVRSVWNEIPREALSTEEAKETARNLFEKAWGHASKMTLKFAPEMLRASGLPFTALLADHFEIVKDFLTTNPDLQGRLGVPEADPAEKLRESLSELLKMGWTHQAPVIFIDDLDRCSPDGSVALLDAIRMLVSQADELHCHFILALDRQVMANAIARKFQGIGQYDGNRYLEKIFPISFELPEPRRQEAEKLTHRFLKQEKVSGLEANHRDALTQVLSEPIFANPRLMKRCINRFRLVIFFENPKVSDSVTSVNSSDSEKAQSDRALAKWIAATERWPALRTLLNQHGDPFWREASKSLAEKQTIDDPELRQLLSQRGARGWLRREMLPGKLLRTEQFRKADRRLRCWGL